MVGKWLAIVGIGEDGLPGLSAIARSLVDRAEIIVGGDRHLAMLPSNDQRQKITWASPISNSVAEIIQHRGQVVCVLASGDPMCYGIGVTLTKQIPLSEITIIPAPSAFSLACGRLGWSLTEVETISLCGRPPALIQSYIYSGARLLILSAGKDTPGIVAKILTQRGYGDSKITVLERMGGTQERIVESTAASWNETDIAALNAIAVDCVADSGVLSLPRIPGLPDNAYHHDGQLTKHEVRAITLATLAPIPGELLWDVGAGCGSISIEWMRTHPRCRAIAIEQNSTRLQYIADNAAALGVPSLQIIAGKAPNSLQDLPQPDAIFIGGGVTADNLFDICWSVLKPGGRLVANVVTIEGEQTLFKWYEKVGGNFTRIAIQRAEPIGKFLGWRGMAPVTQWIAIKSPAINQ
ncbi:MULTISPECIES: bifunctional cobalt-precorrin-7 (C(5))-methyltransferase/cobalt-precorrin-6B (C(15))-methyltransferase [unclassified Tolypothrix]|uniref:bifunctional cobalt-precorrin-7 (C(5))-methyltransferase/cobalt-precorrin-6B (C(15))-methyltransferase n=1 Tax=unclassified Tolypothrix TaxID=2649714 RepID=UPI0005EAA467|nr:MULTISPECIES: bifunctional cobalt-precorrin-7 (C(5))-methyltransferase/cobalt-precorrin-6B (C(15))-methyltransferase [unclassified Tolypothrix]BAY88939.1 precorrin-6y C5,15-methyltransferase (decarboxylating), CbiE subunit [Microchaete diplosiphon NIES-3275]EKF03130.1 precorrin-6Y C5,15-methyltransferase, CbiT subunit [Tolypothrix sp. PCC 7601]MBE9087707.1 bifunctional cobalt-precorrin-7 (C(5))-methyltransferase/cobalt-precorrin-6B (C(15))-methyltransferase [Tolypothrix sp. LEGE 11397]UYD295